MKTRILDLIIAALMVVVGLPKLLGTAKALAEYTPLANAIGIDPTLFRFAAGSAELSVALLLVVGAVVLKSSPLRERATALGYLALAGTMTGAAMAPQS